MATIAAKPAVLREAPHILNRCRDVARHPYNYGVITTSHTETRADAGVRVRVTTRSHLDIVIAALRRDGYAVKSDSRDDEVGEALLVTGWDVDVLRCVAARAKYAIEALIDAHPALATDVIAAYCDYAHTRELAPARAQKLTVDLFHRMAASHASDILYDDTHDPTPTPGAYDSCYDQAVDGFLDQIETSMACLDELIAAHRGVAQRLVSHYRSLVREQPNASRATLAERVAANYIADHSAPQPPWQAEWLRAKYE